MSSGNVEVSKLIFISLLSGSDNTDFMSLSTLGGTPSCPAAEFGFMFSISFSTSSDVVSLKLKPLSAEGAKTTSVTPSFSRVLFPTVAKKLLKVFAFSLVISSGSVFWFVTFVRVASLLAVALIFFNFVSVVLLSELAL